MKKCQVCVFGILFCSILWAADITGSWRSTVENPRGKFEQLFLLKQAGDKLTGYIASPQGRREEIKDGKIAGDQITFTVARQQPDGKTKMVPYKGKVKGDTIDGTFVGPGGHLQQWSARREKQ